MNQNRTLEEQFYKYKGFKDYEKNLYMHLLENCKDIIDSENGLSRNGKIVKSSMIKDGNIIKIDGLLAYETENRTFNGYGLIKNKDVTFNLKFTRLCVDDKKKEYKTLDIFAKTDEGYDIVSCYDYNKKKKYSNTICTKERVK